MKLSFVVFICASTLIPASAGAQQITIAPVIHSIVADESATQAQAPPAPFVYSDGYRTRLKIHKLASKTMLPLVGAQAILGKMVYDNPTPTRRAWHRGVAYGIGGLFAVNSVTGTWNLIEARKDPNGRTRRLVHGILMLASDAGFLATALTNPTHHTDPAGSYFDQRALHRNLAIASLTTATAGYLVMLIHHK